MLAVSEVFERVVVINLARRTERLARFNQLFADWPFKSPERFEAIDGSKIAIPKHWDKSAGAWGCMLSHRQVIESAIADKVSSLMVFEDDAVPVPNFAALASEFLLNVPADWDGLMFGAEHLHPPIPLSPGVVQCTGAIRMHAYALRGNLLPLLYEFLHHFKSDHCDMVLASLMKYFKVYAPSSLLIGQDECQSDITGLDEPLRFLDRQHMSTMSLNKRPLFSNMIPLAGSLATRVFHAENGR